MRVVDYGGRAPQPDAPYGGAVQAWDLATQTHHDYTTGQDVQRPFIDDELVRFAVQLAAARDAAILARIRHGIQDLQAALNVVTADIDDATARAGQANTLATATRVRSTATARWTPTAATATDMATLRTKTVADLTAVRDGVVDVLDRVATVFDALRELYAARALHGQGFALAFTDLIGLAELTAGEITS